MTVGELKVFLEPLQDDVEVVVDSHCSVVAAFAGFCDIYVSDSGKRWAGQAVLIDGEPRTEEDENENT